MDQRNRETKIGTLTATQTQFAGEQSAIMFVFSDKRDLPTNPRPGSLWPQATIANLHLQQNAKTSSPARDMSHNDRNRP